MQHLPFIVFLATGVSAACVFLFRYFIPFSRAIEVLERAYRKEGRAWSYWRDVDFRKKVMHHPERVREESDSKEVLDAKEGILRQKEKMWSTILVGILILVLGFILTIGSGFLRFN